MIRSSLAALVLLLPTAALSADATAPVGEIMAAATSNWQEAASETEELPDYVDYFNEDFLARLYSRDFVEKYREAAKYPIYDDGGSPFGYDVIVMGQDGCAIEDLTVEATPSADGATEVKTTFDNTRCFGERASGWTPAEVRFRVIEEDGKPVVDDIVRLFEGEPQSLKAEMQEIAVEGAAGAGENGDEEAQ